MPGLLGVGDDDPTTANYGSAYPLPRLDVPGTYTGQIPTPPADYGSTRLSTPHDYYQLQLPGGDASTQQMNQLLQVLMALKKQRT